MLDSLNPPSLLLQKNADLFENARVLLLEPELDGVVTAIGKIADLVSVYTSDCRVSDRLQQWQEKEEQAVLYYGYQAEGLVAEYDIAVVFLQKSKPRTDMLLQQAVEGLSDSGQVLLVGENKAGIKSWQKRLKTVLGDVAKLDSARHCVLYSAEKPVGKETFDIESFFETVVIEQEPSLKIHSLPGVFSHGRLDVGTRLLFKTLDTKIKGQVLDFGCGAGVVATAIGKRWPNTRLTLVDISALALESSYRTLKANEIEGAVLASDGLSNVKGRFDLIVSNPPFHEGVSTAYDTTENFIRASKRYLKPRGEFRIVANNFLRYPSIIEAVYGHCNVLASGDGFKVYQAKA